MSKTTAAVRLVVKGSSVSSWGATVVVVVVAVVVGADGSVSAEASSSGPAPAQSTNVQSTGGSAFAAFPRPLISRPPALAFRLSILV